MLRLACFLLPLVLVAGCGGPNARIEKLATDTSEQVPVLQVWTKAHKLEEGHDIKVLVGWNHWLGTGPVNPADCRNDGTCIVKVTDWKDKASDYDRSNEMRVEFTYDGRVLAKKVLPAPTDYANAFNKHFGPK